MNLLRFDKDVTLNLFETFSWNKDDNLYPKALTFAKKGWLSLFIVFDCLLLLDQSKSIPILLKVKWYDKIMWNLNSQHKQVV